MRFVSVPLVFTFLIGLTLQSTNSSFLFRSLYAMTDSLDDEEDDETSCTVCTSWPFQVCPPLCLDTGLCFSITSLNWPFLFFPPNPSSLHDHEMYEATHNTVAKADEVCFSSPCFHFLDWLDSPIDKFFFSVPFPVCNDWFTRRRGGRRNLVYCVHILAFSGLPSTLSRHWTLF
jgi:hypothetical protein